MIPVATTTEALGISSAIVAIGQAIVRVGNGSAPCGVSRVDVSAVSGTEGGGGEALGEEDDSAVKLHVPAKSGRPFMKLLKPVSNVSCSS